MARQIAPCSRGRSLPRCLDLVLSRRPPVVFGRTHGAEQHERNHGVGCKKKHRGDEHDPLSETCAPALIN